MVNAANHSTSSSAKNDNWVELAVEANSEVDLEDYQQSQRQQDNPTKISESKRDSAMAAQQIMGETRTTGRADEQGHLKKLEDFSRISINEMLMEVRSLWFYIDNERGLLELDRREVARHLCSLQVLPDVSSAEKYIQTTIQSKTKLIDYD